jgi:hypothetical protein
MERPLPAGVLKMHSEGTVVNPTTTTAEAAASARRLNTPTFISNTFFGLDAERTLSSLYFPDTSQVVLYNQTGKYSDLSVMALAIGPNTLDTTHSTSEGTKNIETENVYMYPMDVQEEYWLKIMRTMKNFKDYDKFYLKSEGDTRIITGENCIATVTSDDFRTSRSIAVPHTHIMAFRNDSIEPHDNKPEVVPWLAEEQELTKLFAPTIVKRIQPALRDIPVLIQDADPKTYPDRTISETLELTPRDEAPFGYSFDLPMGIDSLKMWPIGTRVMASVMEAHHKAYTKVAKDIEQRLSKRLLEKGYAQFIPQPSYRLYMELVERDTDEHTNYKLGGDIVRVTVSPEFLSHAGIIEAASDAREGGLLLNRAPSNPQRIPVEVLEEAQQYAAQEFAKAGELQTVGNR